LKDTQLQGNPISPQLEGVIHVLDDQFGMIKDLDDNTVRAPPQFNRAWCWFDAKGMRKSRHFALIPTLFIKNHNGGSRLNHFAPLPAPLRWSTGQKLPVDSVSCPHLLERATYNSFQLLHGVGRKRV